MGPIRKPFQGINNIIRFNWHFYVPALLAVFIIASIFPFLPKVLHLFFILLISIILIPTMISLLVSFYVYDLSGIYHFSWLKNNIHQGSKIINIHAGFDESSEILKSIFSSSALTVFDFYNPSMHTEISIKRARKAYPPFVGTIKIDTGHIPVNDNYADVIFLFFAAHEIRDDNEREIFFSELHRVLKPGGEIKIIEHLRDIPNFLAYNIGFLHFLSLKTWEKTFKQSSFNFKLEKINPFVTNFTLKKNGSSS